MGGVHCKTDEERLKRKRESSQRYYEKNKAFLIKDENYKEKKRKSSIKYYYKNKEKCMDMANNWKLKNTAKFKRIQKKAYYKRKHGITIYFIKKDNIKNIN